MSRPHVFPRSWAIWRRANTLAKSSFCRPATAPRCTPWPSATTAPCRTSATRSASWRSSHPRTSATTCTPTSTMAPSTICSRWPPASTPSCWARARSSVRSGRPGRPPTRRVPPDLGWPPCSDTPSLPASGSAQRRRSDGAARPSPTPPSTWPPAASARSRASASCCSVPAMSARAWPAPSPASPARRCSSPTARGTGPSRWPLVSAGAPCSWTVSPPHWARPTCS